MKSCMGGGSHLWNNVKILDREEHWSQMSESLSIYVRL